MGIPRSARPEFRRHLVELYQSGRGLASLSKEFGVPAWPIKQWARQAERKKASLDSRDSGLSQAERRELSRATSPSDAAQVDRDAAEAERPEFEHEPAPSLTMHFTPWEPTYSEGDLPHVPVPLGTVNGGVIREVLSEWQMRCSCEFSVANSPDSPRD